ncbi:tRNA adenosine(34) deaminase TadA [Bacillus sp. CECT 9360]|uniref:tRNA adenosine(34) deaminase TadA n=1 Tax=Bacillus sp. CECT 9360 TaxID=2845821 RepID=UPI001E343F4C|nr:tRNA adenosine(34) deaminase TadA [Bacillus sp. CECT 9360]CAH0347749.1 tRNA-specific adenosine deaminase [Bacillus sp. CECT 9360]
MRDDRFYMRLALEEARKAEDINEVPIGAVIEMNGEVVSSAHNLRETAQNAICHAELLAINKACEEQGTWRLEDATLYVTLEPCPMCAGAIIQSRIKRVVFGAYDPKAGCAGTFMNLLQDERFNHQSEVTSGILAQECGSILTDFFKDLRERKKAEKAKRNRVRLGEDAGIDRE